MAITPAFRGRNKDSYLEIQVPGSGDTTLSEFQASRNVICLQGARTGAGVIRAPVTADDRLNWIIKNETSGDVPLEFGVVSGNSYPVPRGDAVLLYANGTEVSRVVGSVLEAQLTLNSVQIKALHTTPITIVPAPGAGKMLEYAAGLMFLDYGGTNAFVAGAGGLYIGWGILVVPDASQAINQTGFIDQTAHVCAALRTAPPAALIQSYVENTPLTVKAGAAITGNAANDNVLRVKVRYAVHETGW